MKRLATLIAALALLIPSAASADPHPGPWPQDPRPLDHQLEGYRYVQDMGNYGGYVDGRCDSGNGTFIAMLAFGEEYDGIRLRLCGNIHNLDYFPRSPLRIDGWNDTTGSIRVRQIDLGLCLRFYEHVEYDGFSWRVGIGDYPTLPPNHYHAYSSVARVRC